MIFILIIIGIFILEYVIKEYIEDNKEMHKKEEILGGKIIIIRHRHRRT